MFYTYMWLREDGTPYYVGKGTKYRAYQKHENARGVGFNGSPPPKDRIILQTFESEEDALFAEKFLIAYYGRVDTGTGCLRNFTDGGEGTSGQSENSKAKFRKSKAWYVMSEETKEKIRNTLKGRHPSEETRKRLSEALKGHTVTAETRRKIGTGNAKSLKGKAPWNKGRRRATKK